jgi:CO/xanthine dehydrogenase Mo-binding subunit
VRIHLAGVGGAFGGREDLSMQIHGAMLALHTNRPVKIVYTREESFFGHVHRHPARIWAEHRANRDGKLVNVRMRILLDGGAYASSSTAVTSNAASFAVGPYAIENALIESTCVYTNNPPCGAMRGFGAVQTCFASEAQMDKLAVALEMDPVELRLRNAMAPGDALATGQKITGSMPVAEVIRKAAAIPVPEEEELPRDPIRLPGGAGNTTRGEGVRRGVGFAVGFKNIGYSEGFDDYTAARVRLFADAGGELVAEVHCAAAEVGQGVTNVILQTARTELELENVVLAPGTTAEVGSAGSASASRMTWMAAGAVQAACRAIRDELERRGGKLGDSEEIDLERIYRHPRTFPLEPETGQITGGRAHVALACAAMRVVVEVDVELGLTRVVWIGTAQDVGRAVNPQAVYGQIEGGTAQGIGLALMEEIQTRDGLITNASFTDYLIPTALDMPPVDAELVEDPEPDAPYGVKGVGEPPTVVSTAAVMSAMRAATGRDLNRVPVKPDDICL